MYTELTMLYTTTHFIKYIKHTGLPRGGAETRRLPQFAGQKEASKVREQQDSSSPTTLPPPAKAFPQPPLT